MPCKPASQNTQGPVEDSASAADDCSPRESSASSVNQNSVFFWMPGERGKLFSLCVAECGGPPHSMVVIGRSTRSHRNLA